MVSALDRKLLRDLARMRGQVITIALVVACGIASYVTMRSAFDSLVHSRDQYYADYRFGDVFASCKRAPLSLRSKLETLPGVARVQTRLVERVLVPMKEMTRPASGTVVSRPRHDRESALNGVHVTRGRDLDANEPDEVLLLDTFARAHDLEPGDTVDVVINGTLRPLRVVGFALSPEYVMTLAPGQLSYDPATSPVLWMNETALFAAFQMEGAFNSVSLELEPGADSRGILTALDTLLAPYGGFGAVSREKQQSNFMLQGELTQLESMASFVPYLFLFVAALLVNVVLSRLVQLQRAEIATLKAVGYPNRAIGVHYVKLVGVIVLGGAVLGVAVGAWLGSGMTRLYTDEFFRFPDPKYRLEPSTIAFAFGVGAITAVLGAWISARGVMKLPPAEAMRPPAPARFERSRLEAIVLWEWLGPSTRMIWRELSRRPVRLVLSALGVSLAVAILVVGRSMWDAMDQLMNSYLHEALREDITVTLTTPAHPRAVREAEHIPGVLYAEGLRQVPVRFRSGHRFRDSAVVGYPTESRLRHLIEVDGSRFEALPEQGIVLTRKLGEILGVEVGGRVTVELREGQWRTESVTVAGFLDEPFGLLGHMREQALAALLRDSGAVNTLLLDVDPLATERVEQRLKDLPMVASVNSPSDIKRQFDEQSAAIMQVFTFVMTLFAGVIAVGVVYNNTRVALSQRSRELASLRVLGYTRREIATILFGEQAVQVAIAIPLGLVLGHLMSNAMMANADPEAYRLSVVVSGTTYAFAIAVTLASAVISAVIVRRRIQTLDLIAVLKTRE